MKKSTLCVTLNPLHKETAFELLRLIHGLAETQKTLLGNPTRANDMKQEVVLLHLMSCQFYERTCNFHVFSNPGKLIHLKGSLGSPWATSLDFRTSPFHARAHQSNLLFWLLAPGITLKFSWFSFQLFFDYSFVIKFRQFGNSMIFCALLLMDVVILVLHK